MQTRECLWYTMLVEDTRQCILNLLDPLSRRLFAMTNRANHSMPRPPIPPHMAMDELLFRHGTPYLVRRCVGILMSYQSKMSGLPGAYAAHQGNMELLKWIYMEQYSIYSITADYAAAGGQLAVLQWLQDISKLHWSKQTLQQALMYGHATVPLLEWMVQNGCPEPHIQSFAAVRGGNLNILKWLHARGHDMYDLESLIGAAEGRQDIIAWLKKVGIPRPVFWCQNDIAYGVALPDTKDDDI